MVHRLKSLVTTAALAAALSGAAACEGEKAPLAPAATELEPPKPKAQGASKLGVVKASSKVEFLMDAPKEKIRGKVHGTTEGEIQVDLADLTKSTGLITMDIGGIEIFQTVAKEDGTFGDETKSDKQNEHARTWLEISPDTPADQREKNAKVQFAIRKIEVEGEPSLLKRTGAERKVNIKASGELLLHQRKSERTAELEVTFRFEGNKPTGATIRTVKPIAVGLAEHDVHPREAFGKLAQRTLEVLAPKVNKEAMVTLDLTARVAPDGTAPASAPAPGK